MIFWNEISTYKIIEDEGLKQLAEVEGIKLIKNDSMKKETRDWFNYGRVISSRYDFHVINEACFVYYLTLYMAEDGVSAGAEEEYFIQKIDTRISELYYQSSEKESEIEQKILFFNSLLKFFRSGESMDYERKVFQHNVRVSQKIKDWFTSFKTVREGILKLLNDEIEHPHLNIYDPTTTNVVFLLTYSEETVWRNLSTMGDVDRLRILLN